MCYYVNTAALAVLANPAVSALAAQFGVAANTGDDLGAEIIKQMAQHRADEMEAAAAEVIELIRVKEQFLTDQASSIVALQNQIVSIQGVASAVARAQAYGDVTRNYLPLASCLGMDIDSANREFAKIPKDWTAPVAA